MSETAEKSDAQTAKVIAELISEFRLEFADRIRENFEKELAEIEDSSYDPARGRGRGPWWADGD